MVRAKSFEAFKFALYVTIPAVLTFAVATNSDALNVIIKQRAYVVYPPEGPRPPSPDTVHSIARDNSARDAGSRK